MNEEKIKQELEDKFPCLKDAVNIKRKGRIFAQVPLGEFDAVFAYAVKKMGFLALSAITGLDRGDGIFEVIYHLNKEGRVLLNLNVSLDKGNPEVNTVTSYCPSADIYERELMDLLGIKVSGLVPGHRYPLTDDWPKGEYPLRKDWKGNSGKPREAKNA
ncbi:MAG: NADH-quinone oxidoreductase subunit C [Candidatus Omnitrophica bacterium]|nr:NADH-quinone oxidoreductase subunit C [Candidatus Omnitrophota bacterium]MDD5409504.1 NADH-quinone oxidoreductase subunit C [Candidatus Omnitrophota bacterium]